MYVSIYDMLIIGEKNKICVDVWVHELCNMT